MFSYGSFKLFFLKVFLGVVFVVFSGFLLISLLTNNPNDPGIGKLRDSLEIYNYFGLNTKHIINRIKSKL